MPQFETTTNAIRFNLRQTIAVGNAALDRLGALKPREVTFENTVRALDDIGYQISLTDDRFGLIKETSTNAALRDAATDALKELEEWSVGIDYREDVYKAVKAYADKKPKLKGEDAKLLAETMRDYRRAGLDLPKAQRDEVERMRKELTRLTTDYESNITKAQKAVKFTKAELEGVPESFLAQVKTGDDEYTVMANITWHYLSVMDNAKREETRKKLLTEHDNLARAENIPLLEKILPLRDDIARKLGYKTWADYQIEVKMASNAATAIDFLEKLKTGLAAQVRRRAGRVPPDQGQGDRRHECAGPHLGLALLQQPVEEGEVQRGCRATARLFPLSAASSTGCSASTRASSGSSSSASSRPTSGLATCSSTPSPTPRPASRSGLFYLDMFPREGKYNHFAQFRLIEGKLLASGKYQRPTVALICNFPSPTKDKPSLLSHSDVETIFHEFGHAMHSIMTRAKYGRFSGTSVPGDFVEAPSQMLENWVWDKKVLDSFAADYRDPSKKIPADILAKLKEAKLATEGTRYRRQLSFALMDLALHTQIHDSNAAEALPLSNKVLSEVFLPMVPDTAFVAYFGHLMGYDAGYYGYAWADAIAADMATVFEQVAQRLLRPRRRPPPARRDLRAGRLPRRERVH